MAFLLLCLSPLAAFPQSAPRNAAFAEIGGNGVIPTINLERALTARLRARAGFGFISSSSSSSSNDLTYVVPLTLSFVSSPAGNHHLELGGGVTFSTGDRQSLWDVSSDSSFSSVVPTGIVGYRYQRPQRGFVFRAALTPFYDSGDLLPWAGVSFGYGW